jgi:hypothetical protein
VQRGFPLDQSQVSPCTVSRDPHMLLMEAFAQAWQCIQAVSAHQKPLAGLRTRSPVSRAHHLHVSTVGLSKDGFTLKQCVKQSFRVSYLPLNLGGG